MDGYGLVVRFVLHPGHEDAFDHLVAETLEGIRAHEPGTLIYASHDVDSEPSVRIFYELYRDRGGFEEHERQPHTRRFLDERGQHVAAVVVDFVQPVDSKGLPAAVSGA